MAHYLLTGAAGFIASKVAELLHDEGHTVIGLGNLNSAYDVRLKHWRLAQLDAKPGFEFQKLDITNRAAISVIINLAGPWPARWTANEVGVVLNGVPTSKRSHWYCYETWGDGWRKHKHRRRWLFGRGRIDEVYPPLVVTGGPDRVRDLRRIMIGGM